MSERPWINEALHLRFDESLSLAQITARLSVPRTTLQSLFRRFRRSRLTWPLSDSFPPTHPEPELYPGPRTVPEPSPERHRRPNFPGDFKLRLVELSLQPGANVAAIAREHGINDNLLFNWRHLWKQGRLGDSRKTPATLLPVSLTPPLPAETSTLPRLSGGGLHCEVTLCGGTLRLQGAVTPELLRAFIRELKGDPR